MYLPLHKHLERSSHFTKVPSKKEEQWRFSKLANYLETHYHTLEAHKKKPKLHAQENTLYIHDGELIAHQLPSCVHLKTHRPTCQIEYNPFAHLATQTSPYPLELNIFEEAHLDIYLSYSKEHFLCSNLNIILQEGIKASVYMHFKKGEKSFISHANHIKLEANAKLILTQTKTLAKSAVFISQDCLHLHEKSTLQNFNLLHQGAYLHHFSQASLHYKSELKLQALLLSEDEQNLIFSASVEQLGDDSKSEILSKQVLKDKSSCTFEALTKIEKGSKRSQARQASHALLLSEHAQIHAKPHLEIYSDDLSASHGSTVGELDEMAIDYLRSRGIAYEKAKAMLTSAFIKEVIECIEAPTHKEKVLAHLGEYDV